MRRTRRAAAVAAVLASGAFGILAGPQVATADNPASKKFRRFGTNKVELDGTNGYRLVIRGAKTGLDPGGGGGGGEVTIFASNGRVASGGRLRAAYDVGGTSSPRDLEGDFGSFGKVDLHLHVKKTVRVKAPPHCRGTLRRRVGVWRGTVQFEGEDDFAAGSATRAKGYHEVPQGQYQCTGSDDPYVILGARSPSNGSAFYAEQVLRPGAMPIFDATQGETQGDVTITGEARVLGQASQFSYDQDYTHATVSPPWPFSGTATFDGPNYAPDSWSGDLAAELPGMGTTALTGPGDTASLRRVRPRPGD